MPPKEEDRRVPSDSVSIRDFPGLVSNMDPHDVPPGSGIVQVNACSLIPGQLTVRRGTAVLKFDT